MRTLLVAVSAGAILFAVTAQAESSSSHNLNSQDESFIKQAAEGNFAEARLGLLAEEHAGTAAVKEFGRWMATDHGFANKRLMAIAKPLNAWQEPHLTRQQRDLRKRLEGLRGIRFDREYMHAMVSDHEKTVDKFKQEAQQGQDHSVKGYAQNLLPVLQQHLDEARLLAGGAGMAARSPAAISGSSRPPAEPGRNPHR
jgi:putative membrane protein